MCAHNGTDRSDPVDPPPDLRVIVDSGEATVRVAGMRLTCPVLTRHTQHLALPGFRVEVRGEQVYSESPVQREREWQARYAALADLFITERTAQVRIIDMSGRQSTQVSHADRPVSVSLRQPGMLVCVLIERACCMGGGQ